MKQIFLFTLLLAAVVGSQAQSSKITIYCKIDVIGRLDYGHLQKLLQPHLKDSLLIDPRKTYDMKDMDDVLLWMTASGWKLVTLAFGPTGNYAEMYYLLSRDIDVDAATRAQFLEDLKTVEKKKK